MEFNRHLQDEIYFTVSWQQAAVDFFLCFCVSLCVFLCLSYVCLSDLACRTFPVSAYTRNWHKAATVIHFFVISIHFTTSPVFYQTATRPCQITSGDSLHTPQVPQLSRLKENRLANILEKTLTASCLKATKCFRSGTRPRIEATCITPTVASPRNDIRWSTVQ